MKPRSLSLEECANLLSSGKFGRLCLCSKDQPYAVPMSYVFSDGVIYLHSRGGGKKVEFAAANPQVCFEVDSLEEDKWSSVIAYGTVNLSDDINAKARMFDAFTRRDIGGHGGKQFKREELEKMPMTIWEIAVGEITGREGIW